MKILFGWLTSKLTRGSMWQLFHFLSNNRWGQNVTKHGIQLYFWITLIWQDSHIALMFTAADILCDHNFYLFISIVSALIWYISWLETLLNLSFSALAYCRILQIHLFSVTPSFKNYLVARAFLSQGYLTCWQTIY